MVKLGEVSRIYMDDRTQRGGGGEVGEKWPIVRALRIRVSPEQFGTAWQGRVKDERTAIPQSSDFDAVLPAIREEAEAEAKRRRKNSEIRARECDGGLRRRGIQKTNIAPVGSQEAQKVNLKAGRGRLKSRGYLNNSG
ncbi:hypothetical protein B0H13DRAFT_1885663 [Mycena leptocephala]|nr:hypothetical protein B0H13DRAFT_1885663 [Mycena leptocephala]